MMTSLVDGEGFALSGLPETQRVSANTVSARAVADGMVRQIETTAASAMADPAVAYRAGIMPMKRAPLFENRGDPVTHTHADWIRGAVLALLPPGWRYEIVEGVDGTGLLMLLGYEAP